MVSLDIFKQDPFTTIQLTAAIEKVPYVPDGLQAMGTFQDEPVRTDTLWVEQREGKLILVPFSDRGAPGIQRTTEKRNARAFKIPRMRAEDTIYARELAGIRAFGSETELMQVQKEVMRRLVGPTGLRTSLSYTQEFQRLASVQGYLLDADGSIKYNWYDEFGITPNALIYFTLLAKVAGTLRPLIAHIVRTMKRQAKGAFVNSTRVQALCGDAFWDALVTHPDVEKTYLNWEAAKELRKGTAFESMSFADVDWMNYRGSDDTFGLTCSCTKDSATVTPPSMLGIAPGLNVSGHGLANGTIVSGVAETTFTLSNAFTGDTGKYLFNFGVGSALGGGGEVSIRSHEAILFPKGAPGVFQRGLSPADSAEWINTLGKPEYVRMIPDRDRNEWQKVEVDNYPLHICTRPEVLFRASME